MQGRHRALVEVPRQVDPDETEVVVRVLSDYLGSQVYKLHYFGLKYRISCAAAIAIVIIIL